MRFLQTSDLHIGESRALPDYLKRHSDVLYQMSDYAEKHSLPMLIPGDLYHTKTPTYEERLLAEGWICHLERRKIWSLFIPGNHDHVAGDLTLLDNIAQYPLNYVKVITNRTPQRSVAMAGMLVIGVPWGNLTKDEIRESVESELAKHPGNTLPVVVMVHECMVGAKFDNGTISPKGTSLPDMPEVAYWAVGDIHTQQGTNLLIGHYAGAPLQFKFDDNEQKGFLVVDLDSPTKPKFIETQFKKLKTISSVEEMKEDAYYFVKGEVEEVLKAGRHESVIRTDWSRPKKEVVEYTPGDLTEGLCEFLADNGFDETFQERALRWVKQQLPETAF